MTGCEGRNTAGFWKRLDFAGVTRDKGVMGNDTRDAT